MCIIFFCQNRARYKLVLAGNRDEFLNRPTKEAHFWPGTGVFGGTDIATKGVKDGTWMAIDKGGKIGFITNVTQDPSQLKSTAPSRGAQVRDYLLGTIDLETIVSTCQLYNGFNLVVGHVDRDLIFMGNLPQPSQLVIGSGRPHCVSNGRFEDPDWPKVLYGRKKFENLLDEPDESTLIDGLLALLRDDTQLPGTPQGYYRDINNSIYLNPERLENLYGTRTHTICLVDRDNRVFYGEWSHVGSKKSITRFNLEPEK